MAAELRRGERAERDDLLARGTRILDGPLHELDADALCAKRVGHAGVVDDDLGKADLGVGHLGFGTVRTAQDIAALALAFLVLDQDFFSHGLRLPVSAARRGNAAQPRSRWGGARARPRAILM